MPAARAPRARPRARGGRVGRCASEAITSARAAAQQLDAPSAARRAPWRPVSEEPLTCSRAPARRSAATAPSALHQRGAALRVADQRPEPARAHLGGGREEAVEVVAEQRRLEQHPAARRAGPGRSRRARGRRAAGRRRAPARRRCARSSGTPARAQRRAAPRARARAARRGSRARSRSRTCGVTVTSDVPSATASRASSTASSRSTGPSSTPGSRWKWSSVRCTPSTVTHAAGR